MIHQLADQLTGEINTKRLTESSLAGTCGELGNNNEWYRNMQYIGIQNKLNDRER